MKKLYLVRHAKSSWKYRALRDFERPLKKSGTEDAIIMARHLKAKNIFPEHWVSSPAKRAFTTAEIFAEELGFSKSEVKTLSGIYASSVDEMKTLILGLPNEVNSTMLFGHEPTLSYICELLSNRSFDKVPTSGVVALSFNVEQWGQIRENSAQIDFFIYPKMFRK
ncbi:MAG: histidine phosphatase family protein [Chitinophagales bacterium]